MATVFQGTISYNEYYDRMEPTPIKGIYNSMIQAGGITSFLPTVTIPDFRVRGKILDSVPVPTPMNIDQEPTGSFVNPLSDYEEEAMLWRDNLEFDELWQLGNPIEGGSITKIDVDSYGMGMRFAQNNVLINGTGEVLTVNGVTGVANVTKTLVGIKTRLQNPAKYNTLSQMNVLSQTKLNAANRGATQTAQLAIEFKKMFSYMNSPEGNGIKIVVNPQVSRIIDASVALSGNQGGFSVDEDNFGRTVTKFKGAEIVDCGYLPPLANGNQIAPIIDNSQDALGNSLGDTGYTSGGSYTSIYFIKAGEDSFATWQMFDPKMRKVNLNAAGLRRVRVMWDTSLGIWQPNTRAIGRLYGVLTDGSSQD